MLRKQCSVQSALVILHLGLKLVLVCSLLESLWLSVRCGNNRSPLQHCDLALKQPCDKKNQSVRYTKTRRVKEYSFTYSNDDICIYWWFIYRIFLSGNAAGV